MSFFKAERRSTENNDVMSMNCLCTKSDNWEKKYLDEIAVNLAGFPTNNKLQKLVPVK